MLTSIPILALKLGIGFKEYEEVAENIKKVSLISKFDRQKILERANKEFPDELKNKISDLVYLMADDRQVYKIAELKYSDGPPKGENLFTTSLVDYLLRHKPFN